MINSSSTSDQTPVLITGLHRSGTTWVGEVVGSAPNMGYIREPFNPHYNAGILGIQLQNYYQYICEENGSKYYDSVKNLINFKLTYSSIIQRKIDSRPINWRKLSKDIGRMYLYRIKNLRPLIKCPFSFFSAEWYAKQFNTKIIILVRHPAAFISSILLKQWSFDFNNFTSQPLLMRNHLQQFEIELKSENLKNYDIIDQGILLWKIFASVLNYYRKQHPDWLIIKHEDISKYPIDKFKSIASYISVPFSEKMENKIKLTTNTDNPSVSKSSTDVVRNSGIIPDQWKTRLSQHEIERIYNKIEPEYYIDYYPTNWGYSKK